jgi:hypothetical protein
MKFIWMTVALLILVSQSAISKNELDSAKELYKAETLNKKSMELLGIDLQALSYLLTVKFDTNLPYREYRESGDFRYFVKLEDAGYIKIEFVDEYSEGSNREKQFRLNPLMKALEVQAGVSFGSQSRKVEIEYEHRMCKLDDDCAGMEASCESCNEFLDFEYFDRAVNRRWKKHYAAKREKACNLEVKMCIGLVSKQEVKCVEGICQLVSPYKPQ